MKLSELPTDELRRALADTERIAGRNSASARILRRELARREAAPRRTPKPRKAEGGAK